MAQEEVSVICQFDCERNGMLRHSLDGSVICISLQHFIVPALDLMLCVVQNI